MRQINTYTGQHFIFHLIKEGENISMTLSSDYVYPTVDNFESAPMQSGGFLLMNNG